MPALRKEKGKQICALEASQGNVETLCQKTKTKVKQGGKGRKVNTERGRKGKITLMMSKKVHIVIIYLSKITYNTYKHLSVVCLSSEFSIRTTYR